MTKLSSKVGLKTHAYLRCAILRILLKWWSYIMEIRLDSVQTAIDGQSKVYVALKKGRLLLGTDQTIYSWDDLYMNFSWAFEEIDFSRWIKPRILLLGLGLGSVPYILEKKFRLEFDLLGVEINQLIIDLFERYSKPRLNNSVEAIHDNAFDFLKNCESQYDIIIVDVCVEDYIPVECTTSYFLEHLKQRMKEGAIVLYNRFYSTFRDRYYTDSFYIKLFKKAFGSTKILDFEGTAILIGGDLSKLKSQKDMEKNT